jgi:large repetitive protein
MTTNTRVFAFLIATGFAARLDAQMQGSFSPAGSLTTVREGHTASLLTNGQVLIAGGFAILAGWPVWASAEIFDPVAGTFTATGSMASPRSGHTATLLPDGRILIAGGVTVVEAPSGNYPPPLSSAEVYDPSTGAFSATGNMSTGRSGHAATLLNNGKVLITGGAVDASAELYDPSTGTFSPAGNMTAVRDEELAVLLPNGKVLIEGGGGCAALPPPELYDPVTSTFALTGASANPDLYPMTATLLLDGTVLTTMNVPCDIGNGAEIYNSATGTFTAANKLPSASDGFLATLLPSGQVFLNGELLAAGVYQAGGSFLLYDPHTGAYSTAPGSFPQSDESGTSTLLANGAVLMAGGWICCGFSVADAETYLPANDTPAPMLYAISGGTQGAILHGASQQLVSPSNPAVAGEAIEIYGAGLVEGGAIPPQVFIGGRMAQVLFFGDAPGFAGLNQINVVVPSGLASGSNATVQMLYLARPSNQVTLAVQ